VSCSTRISRACWHEIFLLRLAEQRFEVFVTADRRLPHQQTVRGLRLGIVVLQVGSTKLEDLRPYSEAISIAIDTVSAGRIAYVPDLQGE
jgi:hypothetical protein